MGQYDDLLGARGREILERLYPHMAIPDCPMTADAVDDYLNTGEVVAVPMTFSGRFSMTANWRRIQREQLINHVRTMGANHHVVVRGTRPRDSPYTRNHYFVLANIRGNVYVVDAMTREVTSDVQGYINRQGFNRLDYTQRFEASEEAVY
jgi:hypothetical protein